MAYIAPTDPYLERQESVLDYVAGHPTIWDGCGAWSLGWALNGATGGRLRVSEDDVRIAINYPEIPGRPRPWTTRMLVAATRVLAPGLWYAEDPTPETISNHLAHGGLAVLSGWQHDAPACDRAAVGSYWGKRDASGNYVDGHSCACQGDGAGNVRWFNPLVSRLGAASIGEALHFPWVSTERGVNYREALLFNPAAKPVEVETDMPQPADIFYGRADVGGGTVYSGPEGSADQALGDCPSATNVEIALEGHVRPGFATLLPMKHPHWPGRVVYYGVDRCTNVHLTLDPAHLDRSAGQAAYTAGRNAVLKAAATAPTTY